MRCLRTSAVVVAVVVTALLGESSAWATELDGPSEMISTGAAVAAQSEGVLTWHTALDVSCRGASFSGETSTTGTSTETVKVKLTAIDFQECGSWLFEVLQPGALEIHTEETNSNNDGVVTSTGTEVTTEGFGLHCIYKTNATRFGTITGSANTGGAATLDIEARIPRTGGRSGAFCGSEAEWTGSYTITNPGALNIT